jgi:hypothetical protein
MATSDDDSGTLPLDKWFTLHLSQQTQHFILPHSIHSKVLAMMMRFLLHFLFNLCMMMRRREFISSYSLQCPSSILEFDGEFEGDKSYNAEGLVLEVQ